MALFPALNPHVGSNEPVQLQSTYKRQQKQYNPFDVPLRIRAHTHTHFNNFNRIKNSHNKARNPCTRPHHLPKQVQHVQSTKISLIPYHTSVPQKVHSCGRPIPHPQRCHLHAHGPSFSVPPHSLSLSLTHTHTHTHTHTRTSMHAICSKQSEKKEGLPAISKALVLRSLLWTTLPAARSSSKNSSTARSNSSDTRCLPRWFFFFFFLLLFPCLILYQNMPHFIPLPLLLSIHSKLFGSFGNIGISKELEGRKFELHWTTSYEALS